MGTLFLEHQCSRFHSHYLFFLANPNSVFAVSSQVFRSMLTSKMITWIVLCSFSLQVIRFCMKSLKKRHKHTTLGITVKIFISLIKKYCVQNKRQFKGQWKSQIFTFIQDKPSHLCDNVICDKGYAIVR